MTQASLSVLVELYTMLGRYSEALVLIGGWAPYLLLKEHKRADNDFEHVGSIDVDIAVDPAIIDAGAYATVVELIEERGYEQRCDKNGKPIPASFERLVRLKDRDHKVQVDFVTEPSGEMGTHRHRNVQPGLRARMLKGCSVVFEHNFKHRLTEVLPGDGEASADIKVADIVGILTTKGFALGERYKEKDAYDVYAVVANYEGGPADTAKAVGPALGDRSVREALERIDRAFSSRTASGPSWVATFLGGTDAREKERLQTDAYENVRAFIERCLGHPPGRVGTIGPRSP